VSGGPSKDGTTYAPLCELCAEADGVVSWMWMRGLSWGMPAPTTLGRGVVLPFSAYQLTIALG